MADHDDDFDGSSTSSWLSDGTAPLDPNPDSTWMAPADSPPAAAPPDPAVVEPSVAPPPEPPPVRRSVAPRPDAPAVTWPAPPPPDAPPPDWTVPAPDQGTARRRRSGFPVAIIVGVAVLAVLGGAVYAAGHSVRHHFAGPTLPKHCGTPTYHLSDAATSAPPVSPLPASATSGQTSTSQQHHLAFAVPTGWQPDPGGGLLVGFENRCGDPQIVLGSVAQYGAGYCAKTSTSYRAIAGVRGAEREHDLPVVAREAAAAWATWAYAGKNDEQPQVVVSRARPFTARAMRGSLVRATARSTVPLECGSVGGVVYAIAVDSTDGADVFVVSAGQGDPADPTETALLAIAGSLHRVP